MKPDNHIEIYKAIFEMPEATEEEITRRIQYLQDREGNDIELLLNRRY